MNFIRTTSLLLGLSVVTGPYETQAKLPLNVFKGVTPSFEKNYKNFSPTLGMAALDSSIIYNLRFYGNFNYKNREKPIEDEPLDAISLLVKEMFPSNTGELGVGMTAPQWLSNNLESPFLIAKLLNFVNTVRESGGQVPEEERLKLIADLKENWEKEYPEIAHTRSLFQLDYETVLKKEPENFNALKVALKNMVVLNVDKTKGIFIKRNNLLNDKEISVFNKIVDIRNSEGAKEQIDAIMNNAEIENDLKISKIKEIIESKLVIEKDVKDEKNKSPVVFSDLIKDDIAKDIGKVKEALEKWGKPKDLKSAINSKTNFNKEMSDLLNRYKDNLNEILSLDIEESEKLEKLKLELQEDRTNNQTIVNSIIENLRKATQTKPLSAFPIQSITRSKNIKSYAVKDLFEEDDIKQLFKESTTDVQKIATILDRVTRKALSDETIQKIISESSPTDNKETVNNEKESAINRMVDALRKTTKVSPKRIVDTINHIYGNGLLGSNITISLRSGEPLQLTSKINSLLNDKTMSDSDKISRIIGIFVILKTRLEHESASPFNKDGPNPLKDELIKRIEIFRSDRDKARENRYNKFFEDEKKIINNKEVKLKSTLNKILDAITVSIQNELNNDPVYPKHTTEQIILAYFCEKFNTQDELRQLLIMLSEINPKIIDTNEINLEQMTADELYNATLPKNFDTVYYFLNADKFLENNPIPQYSNTNNLLSNNTTYAFDRSKTKITDKTFQDCVEIAIRHFMNLVLYNPMTKQFDLSAIKEYVNENDPHNPYFPNFVAFYEEDRNPSILPLLKNNEPYQRQTPDRVENGSQATRSGWNMVVGDLNAGVSDVHTTRIKYLKNGRYEYELQPGFINFILVCQKIFGLKFDHGKYDESKNTEEKLEWLKKSFNTLFEALTVKQNTTGGYKKTLKANFDRLKFADVNDTKDFFGNVKITVSQNNESLFSFVLNAMDVHSYVSQLTKTSISKSIFLDRNSDYGVTPQTAEEVLWLLSANKTNDKIKERATHLFYRLFDTQLKENSSKIEFLNKVQTLYDINNPFYSAPTFKAILENIVSSLNLEDRQALRQAAPILLALNERNIIGSDSLGRVNMGGDYVSIITPSTDEAANVQKFIRLAMESKNPTLKKDHFRDLIMYSSDYDPKKSSTKALEVILANISFNNAIDFKSGSPFLMKLLDLTSQEQRALLTEALSKISMAGIDFRSARLGESDHAIALLGMMLKVNNPTLTKLDLSTNYIYDRHVTVLADALKNNNVLTTLDLHYNYIYEEGVKALIGLRDVNTTLESVNISENPFSLDEQIREALIQEFMLKWGISKDKEPKHYPEACCMQ